MSARRSTTLDLFVENLFMAPMKKKVFAEPIFSDIQRTLVAASGAHWGVYIFVLDDLIRRPREQLQVSTQSHTRILFFFFCSRPKRAPSLKSILHFRRDGARLSSDSSPLRQILERFPSKFISQPERRIEPHTNFDSTFHYWAYSPPLTRVRSEREMNILMFTRRSYTSQMM